MHEKVKGKKEAYIWGAAAYGLAALEYCKDKFKIVGFIDKRADLQFKEFCGLPVISPLSFLCHEDRNNRIAIIAVRYPAEVIQLAYESSDRSNISFYIFDAMLCKENPLLYQVKDGEICIPEYMDKHFLEWQEYSEHYSKLNHFVLEMFRTALKWITKYEKNIEICELGCGSGQFANMLFDYGYTNYVGIDFSNQAIEFAKRANPHYADRFICEDVFSYLWRDKKEGNALFFLFEVLEHMNRDVELLEMLPLGSTVIFSVPNFKSFNHIRTYENLETIKSRYQRLDIFEYLPLSASQQYVNKCYHLVAAVKI
ncbi:MAG: class I SAM-dependent methyltransferase [Lachnospiraceae bacterium]|jgi:2-polyprenyl-3-methyl-5-hydroxy-6-metoxy-1,4-benzoquinol methylase|nr:class I SAM-dependent methyltransferase [Lachnospiraceae bacterium]